MLAQRTQALATRRISRRGRATHLLLLIPLAVILCIFIASLASVALTSLQVFGEGRIMSGTFTLGNYARFLTDPYYLNILLWTLWMGVVVTCCSLLLGYPAAYVIARTRRHKGLLIALAVSPILITSVIRTYAWLGLLANNGLINRTMLNLELIDLPLPLMYNRFGIGLGLTHVLLPYMILSLVASLQTIDVSLEDAARSLGASAQRAFLTVTLPLSLPGIVAGSLLVFTLTIASFITPAILGSPQTKMLSEVIYETFVEAANWPFAAAISFILLAISLGSTVAYSRLIQSYTRHEEAGA
jgi:putative spermidine/putrescine transport system permease protein